MWQLQPLFPLWRSPALTQQPRHQYGTVEDLCSKLPVQSQTAARLARPPEAWGPMRTFGCLDDVHHQVICGVSGELHAFDRTEMVQDIPWGVVFTIYCASCQYVRYGSRDELNQSSPSRKFILTVAGWGVFKALGMRGGQ